MFYHKKQKDEYLLARGSLNRILHPYQTDIPECKKKIPMVYSTLKNSSEENICC